MRNLQLPGRCISHPYRTIPYPRSSCIPAPESCFGHRYRAQTVAAAAIGTASATRTAWKKPIRTAKKPRCAVFRHPCWRSWHFVPFREGGRSDIRPATIRPQTLASHENRPRILLLPRLPRRDAANSVIIGGKGWFINLMCFK